jgi:hypothetical protein
MLALRVPCASQSIWTRRKLATLKHSSSLIQTDLRCSASYKGELSSCLYFYSGLILNKNHYI